MGAVVTGVGRRDGGLNRTKVDDALPAAEAQSLRVRVQRIVERQPVVATPIVGQVASKIWWYTPNSF